MKNLDDIIQLKLSFLEKIFGRYNVKLSRDQKNISIPCPICNKNNGKLKLAVRVLDDLCHCWVCSWSSKSLLPIIIKYFKNYSDEYRGITKNNIVLEDLNVTDKEILSLPKDFKMLSLMSKSEKENYKRVFYYLKKRNIDDEDLWRFKLGISEETRFNNRIVIPSFDINGDLNYYTARSIFPSSVMKYLTCGRSKNDIIFNEIYIDFEKAIKICEGPFDMFKLGSNTTCLQGSELSEESKLFHDILLNKTNIILCLDNDAKLKTQIIAKKFFEYDINVKILDIGQNHDPGEMSKNQIEEMIETNCNEYNWKEFMKSKLDNIKFRNII
jgi:DNA primase